MNCRECESVLPSYAAGDVNFAGSSACLAHLDSCQSCREELERYHSLIAAVADEPLLQVSPAESAELAAALGRAQADSPPLQRPTEIRERGLPALLAASVFAFICIAVALALEAFGVIGIGLAITAVSPGFMVLVWLVVAIVTCFIPIAVTAYRRPLNGLTFRR